MRFVSLRRLTLLNANELFSCEKLQCRLTYKDCALRHAKGAALRRGDAYALVPEKWARYATPCRTCQDGARTQQALGVVAPRSPGPNKPPSPVLRGGRRALQSPQEPPYRHCQACPKLYRGLSALCPVCRQLRRSAAQQAFRCRCGRRMAQSGLCGPCRVLARRRALGKAA